MKKLNIYIAGKVSPTSSVSNKLDWRGEFCKKLTKLTGYEIFNLDPIKTNDDFFLDENNPQLIFGRDCFMIKSADFVIVNLTDDISVGGSQEMLIAKYFKKPLIGIAKKEGKFYKSEKKFLNKVYKNWTHPFVAIPCDVVVEDIADTALFIKNYTSNSNKQTKSISVIDESIKYYKKNYHKTDSFLHNL